MVVTAGLQPQQTCRQSFNSLGIMTVITLTLYIQEVMLTWTNCPIFEEDISQHGEQYPSKAPKHTVQKDLLMPHENDVTFSLLTNIQNLTEKDCKKSPRNCFSRDLHIP
ncbi:hypothetical protein J6590_003588 [Homalodisca vitripennis]|nr:hypothetical protein J6590_003588 [Homalodisca vitripennis]